jgi:hypothetical protein
MLAVVALILDLCMKKARALNKMILRHSRKSKLDKFKPEIGSLFF